jgi:hypothetical protein
VVFYPERKKLERGGVAHEGIKKVIFPIVF